MEPKRRDFFTLYFVVDLDYWSQFFTSKGPGVPFYTGEKGTPRCSIKTAIDGINKLKAVKVYDIHIISSSQYVVNTMNGIYQKKKNTDLWDRLDKAMLGLKVTWEWESDIVIKAKFYPQYSELHKMMHNY